MLLVVCMPCADAMADSAPLLAQSETQDSAGKHASKKQQKRPDRVGDEAHVRFYKAGVCRNVPGPAHTRRLSSTAQAAQHTPQSFPGDECAG